MAEERMIDTVFVIGAGASSEIGLPLGVHLKDTIVKSLDIRTDHVGRMVSGSRHVESAVQHHITSLAKNAHEGDAIRKLFSQALNLIQTELPLADSIDHYLASRTNLKAEIQLLGKLGIAQSILAAERASAIHPLQATKGGPQLAKGTWYTKFSSWLRQHHNKDTIRKRLESVALIVFNYDRCIEYYLLQHFQTYYSITEAEAWELVNLILVVHPYGVVGELPLGRQKTGVAFGNELAGHDLLACSRTLVTFTEFDNHASERLIAAKNAVAQATKVIFLGLAFEPTNVRLLTPDVPGRRKKIYGTGKGRYTEELVDLSNLLSELREVDEVNIKIGVGCDEIFDRYFIPWRS